MSDKVRERFEAWARGPDGVLPDDCTPVELDGCEAFCYCTTSGARIELTDEWSAWQASRAAALEEAVAECEKVARDAVENGMLQRKPFNFVDGAYHAAAAIRAIAGRGA